MKINSSTPLLKKLVEFYIPKMNIGFTFLNKGLMSGFCKKQKNANLKL